MIGLVVGMMLMGCQDISLVKNVQGPRLLVIPESLDFGNVMRGGRREGVVHLVNAGDEAIDWVGWSVDGSFDIGLVDVSQVEGAMGPGEFIEVLLEYEPLEYGEDLGRLVVGDIEVPLSGFGDGPKFVVEPEYIDYGVVGWECLREEVVHLTNMGNVAMEVSDIQLLGGGDLVLDGYVGGGFILDGGERRDVRVAWSPTVVGDVIGRLDIYSTEGDVSVDIEGEGVEYVWQEDGWNIPFVAYLDILFVVDDSGSMMVYQQRLQAGMFDFMSNFIGMGADWQIGVIGTSSPRLVGVVDSGSVNPIYDVMNLVDIGAGGSGDEAGLQMSYECLLGDCGNGFRRVGSDLHIIYISDEPDHSAQNWYWYANMIDGMGLGSFHAHGVITPVPDGCVGGVNINNAGLGYYEFVNYYSGELLSICETNWGQGLQLLSNSIVVYNRFYLSRSDIIVDTLEVRVNGLVVEEGWEYDEIGNVVVFDSGHIPSVGDSIDIGYEVDSCGN